MGLSLGAGRWLARASAPTLRMSSLNIGFAANVVPAAARQALESGADFVLLQDAGGVGPRLTPLLDGWTVRVDGEFVLATRHPIREVFVPPPLEYAKGTGGAHYVQYTLETPLGLIDVFNVHPTTPRPALEELRGTGLRYEILSGRLFAGAASEAVEWNAFRRNRQVAGIAARAAASPNAVVIAGDTNLPGLSRILNDQLGAFDDAFARAGLGFGYTFPAKRPWMRIDRVLTNGKLVALESSVWVAPATDHRGISAVVARRSPPSALGR